jgi:hypothetical protein
MKRMFEARLHPDIGWTEATLEVTMKSGSDALERVTAPARKGAHPAATGATTR